MPLLTPVAARRPASRLLSMVIYFVLAVGGVTMLYPLLLTVAGASSNAYDYYRYGVYPRFLTSRPDRFLRALVDYFPEAPPSAGGITRFDQFRFHFDAVPDDWSSWRDAGSDAAGAGRFAAGYLDIADRPDRLEQFRRQAADYQAFADGYDLPECTCSYRATDLAHFFQAVYRRRAADAGLGGDGLALLQERWQRSVDGYDALYFSIYEATPGIGYGRSFAFEASAQFDDYLALCRAYRERALGPVAGSTRENWPAAYTRPVPMKLAWLRFLNSDEVKSRLGWDLAEPLSVQALNRTFGTHYASLRSVAFPVVQSSSTDPRLWTLWEEYLRDRHPVRFFRVEPSPQVLAAYRAYLAHRFKTVEAYNRTCGVDAASFDALSPAATVPARHADVWVDFVRTLPLGQRVPMPATAEEAYQRWLAARYGSVGAINQAYGWSLAGIEEAEMPFDAAYLVTFLNHESALSRHGLVENYAVLADYLFGRSRAAWNTAWVCLLEVLGALTVNPLAAYALSRFELRATPRIILFFLATMAFPSAVVMIPNYVLVGQLGLMNSLWALVLPSLANGMSIFMLKGFFDSLPRELYEAATLDGAGEMRVLFSITMPMLKPILALTALSTFIAAYASWEWPLLVCQKPDVWTLSIWLYQFSENHGQEPYLLLAGFVVAAVPTFLVFSVCQKVILKGIAVPSLK